MDRGKTTDVAERRPSLRFVFLAKNATEEMAHVQRNIFKEEHNAQHTCYNGLDKVAATSRIYVKQVHHAK